MIFTFSPPPILDWIRVAVCVVGIIAFAMVAASPEDGGV